MVFQIELNYAFNKNTFNKHVDRIIYGSYLMGFSSLELTLMFEKKPKRL